MIRIAAFLGVAALIGLIALYVREFEVFARTLQARSLVLGAMAIGAGIIALGVYALRSRFQPWDRHVTELLLLGVFGVLFSPLFGSWLNRAVGQVQYESFEFVSETPYLTAGYGVIKGKKISPTGYRLQVRREGQLYRLRYRQHAYFPLSRPGDTVALPLRTGLFGVQVMESNPSQ